MAFTHAFLIVTVFAAHSWAISLTNHPNFRIHGYVGDGFVIDAPIQREADYGQPLFLTPYVQSGQLAEARNLSLVGPLAGTTRSSYSGFLTVNPTYNSNIFFWYFPAMENPSTAPVVVWLQGGPGSSSMFGLFAENGPFYIDSAMNLHDRDINWATPFNMIFIDNPVGAGFSFTESDDGYARNETDVARDLYEALQQLFTIFSDLQLLDFYVTGESYGGKYIPAISYKIYTENPVASLKINLKGMAIGDGLIDPVTQFDYGDYFYNVGLIDAKQRELFYEQQQQMVQNIDAGDYMSALYNFDVMVNGGFVVNSSYYKNFTHLHDTYNYIRQIEPISQNFYSIYLQKPEVRKSIHVGNLTFSDGETCQANLHNDICQSTKSWVEELLNNDYRVLLYTGQLDVIVPYYVTMNMIYSFNWKGGEQYRNATRIIWKVQSGDSQVAGYVKGALNFLEIMVRDAGHILPQDQPRVAYDMITRFIFNQPFTNN